MQQSSPGATFQVAFTGDFLNSDGAPRYREFGLDRFECEPRIAHQIISGHSPVLSPEQIGDSQGVVVLAPQVTRESLAGRRDLLAIARFGVGFDSVDVAACTEHDVLVLIAVGAVDRSVAEATLMWMLALSHHLLRKDRLVRTGDWAGRGGQLGTELRGRTLGLVGFGRIARALVPLLKPFGMRRILAYDPHLDPEFARSYDVSLVSLDELLEQSNFVSVHCPLEPKTRNLIAAPQLAKMKPTAYLLNTSRGGIIDEQALYTALKEERLGGAALDVFDQEPFSGVHPLAEFENVLLAPHCIAWTEELFREIGQTVCQSLVDLAQGRNPWGMVNPQVLESPGFRAKWERLALAEM